MKYKVTAKKKIGSHYINDWFNGQLSHMGYYTDSIKEAKKVVQERIKRGKYYDEECVPQIIFTNSREEVV